MKIPYSLAYKILIWLFQHKYITRKEAVRIMDIWKREGFIEKKNSRKKFDK